MELAAEDSRIRVLDQAHGGVSSARNAGLEQAVGDYVTFIDSDDWIHPAYFETLLHFSDRLEVDCVACRLETVSEEKPIAEAAAFAHMDYAVKGKWEAVNDAQLKNNVCAHLYPRELVKDLRFPEGVPVGEDAIFNMEWMTKRDPKMAVVSERMYFYYSRMESAMHTRKSSEWVVPFVDWYMKQISGEPDEAVRGLYILEVLKKLFNARYGAQFGRGEKAFLTYCRKEIRKCCRMMWRNSFIPLKRKAAFTMFSYVPQVYRMWRIYDDPTLRDWERQQKGKLT